MWSFRQFVKTGSGAIAATVIALALSSCGSGSEGDGESVSRAEFVAEANSICNGNNEYLRKELVEFFGPDQQPDDESGIRYTREVWVPNLRQQNEDLRALAWPEADRQQIESMLAAHDRATVRIEADPAVASQGPFDRVTRQMTAYGIGPCGSP